MGEFTEIADLRPRTTRDGLQVDAALAAFLENDVLAPLALDASAFWAGFAGFLHISMHSNAWGGNPHAYLGGYCYPA